MTVIPKQIAELKRKLEHANAKAVMNAEIIEELSGALVELGELYAEQDDALVELAGLIEEGE